MSDNDWPREAIVFRVAMGRAERPEDFVRNGAIVEGVGIVSQMRVSNCWPGRIAVVFAPADAISPTRIPMHPHGYPIIGIEAWALIPLTAPARALHAIAAAEVES